MKSTQIHSFGGYPAEFQRRIAKRLNSRVDRPDPLSCWEWQGARDRNGYGVFRVHTDGTRTETGAHRVAYILAVGSIQEGLVIDHLCRNRACCNPSHLEAVTAGENTRRGIGIGRRRGSNKLERGGVCKHGHPLDESNYRERLNGQGYLVRYCRECQYLRHKAWKMKRAA